ncbi:type 11 methyltransferase [Mesorhizobium sp. 131-2-1]|nr:type 11 methyltransferase [Mesorhizobium sp. 131-2-1]BCH04398.1 type 11 methyltransferase [Mesorhizobium sp. 131-2-5]
MDMLPSQNALKRGAEYRIKASYALDGDANRVADYYHEWADSYELDVDRARYCGHVIVAELAGAVQASYIERTRAATTVLDAGCGTGLVGIQLGHLGFRLIDGFDLSETMAEMARQTGTYRNIVGNVDLNMPLLDYSSASYDITVCCGVFALGHVRPDRLRELARVTRPNGFVVVSACTNYARETLFQDEVLHLQNAGVVAPAQCLSDGRYLEGEDAHYWVLRVPDQPLRQQIRRICSVQQPD